MVVCSCRAVNDGTIEAAISAGARTVSEIAAHCSAGARCGGCWPELERLLGDHLRR